MSPQTPHSANGPFTKRIFAQALAIIAALSAILGVFSFFTGWTNLRSLLSAIWSHDHSGPTKHVARSVDLSPYIEGLSAREFQVPLGGVIGGFAFTTSGDVSYQGASFRPRVHFTPDATPEILVSIPPSGAVAAIVGLDSDGQRSFFLVHLDEKRSTFYNAPARDLYWSPDQYHLLTLNVYEGQYVSSIDLETDSFKSSDFLGRNGTLWYIEGRARWSTDGRLLFAKAVEASNPYEAEDAQRAVNQTPQDTFLISIDVESLAVTVHD